MKKLFLVLTLFVSFFAAPRTLSAQSLSLTAIDGFPDTVIDNQVVQMVLLITKTGGTVFSGDLTVFIHAVADSSDADTLFHDPQYSLSGNTFADSIVVTYQFKASELDGGDNIVVVWPSSSQVPNDIVQDSLVFNLHLKNVGIDENERLQSISIYPNPSRTEVQILFGFPEKVEQVRVLDVLGKELLRFDSAVLGFNVESLTSGIYFVEVRSKDRSLVVKKFFRE